jgi:hypothetical protein
MHSRQHGHRGVQGFPATLRRERGLQKYQALFVLRVLLLLTRAVLLCSSASTPTSAGAALVGVGMEFDSQRMIITGLRPGCAAAYSKQITIGDHLVAVDGHETYDFKRARDLILGTQGSSVAITFKKNGSSQLYTVSLLRGTADYIHMAERCKHLDTRIAQLEAENKQLLEAASRPTRCWSAKCRIAHMSKSTCAIVDQRMQRQSGRSEMKESTKLYLCCASCHPIFGWC